MRKKDILVLAGIVGVASIVLTITNLLAIGAIKNPFI